MVASVYAGGFLRIALFSIKVLEQEGFKRRMTQALQKARVDSSVGGSKDAKLADKLLRRPSGLPTSGNLAVAAFLGWFV